MQLADRIDGDEQFMRSGHSITKIRKYTREAPDWAYDTEKIRNLISNVFPNVHVDPAQRLRAGRWARIISLYFQAGYTSSYVAGELGEKPRTVEMVIRSIKRAMAGERADGSGLRKGAPDGVLRNQSQ